MFWGGTYSMRLKFVLFWFYKLLSTTGIMLTTHEYHKQLNHLFNTIMYCTYTLWTLLNSMGHRPMRRLWLWQIINNNSKQFNPHTGVNLQLLHLCFKRIPSCLWQCQHQHNSPAPLFNSQGLFGKSLDSPAAADASDTQSVDSGLSRQDSGTDKRDTVCQVSTAFLASLFLNLKSLWYNWAITMDV